MKLTFTKLLCTSLMLTFLVGCGKDNASGGGTPPATNLLQQGNIPADSQQAFKNVSTWYSNNVEGYPSTLGSRLEKRTITNYSNSNNCDTKTFLGFFNINYCLESSSNNNVSTAERTVYLVSNQSKSTNNPKLVSVFSPATDLKLHKVSELPSPGGEGYHIYVFDYIKPNNHVLRYVIDTGLHSAFNPIEIHDTEIQRSEKLLSF